MAASTTPSTSRAVDVVNAVSRERDCLVAVLVAVLVSVLMAVLTAVLTDLLADLYVVMLMDLLMATWPLLDLVVSVLAAVLVHRPSVPMVFSMGYVPH